MHRAWLSARGLAEPGSGLGEDAYTGLLLSALLDPVAAPAVYAALLSGRPATRGRPQGVLDAEWPSRGVDLIVWAGRPVAPRVLLVEHKRFASPSHAPGYRNNPQSAWQTDQVHEAATGTNGAAAIPGVPSGGELDLVVLDAGGRTMEQMFPLGAHNTRWHVTGYRELGDVFRVRHDAGTAGLVPLLRGLYAAP